MHIAEILDFGDKRVALSLKSTRTNLFIQNSLSKYSRDAFKIVRKCATRLFVFTCFRGYFGNLGNSNFSLVKRDSEAREMFARNPIELH